MCRPCEQFHGMLRYYTLGELLGKYGAPAIEANGSSARKRHIYDESRLLQRPVACSIWLSSWFSPSPLSRKRRFVYHSLHRLSYTQSQYPIHFPQIKDVSYFRQMGGNERVKSCRGTNTSF